MCVIEEVSYWPTQHRLFNWIGLIKLSKITASWIWTWTHLTKPSWIFPLHYIYVRSFNTKEHSNPNRQRLLFLALIVSRPNVNLTVGVQTIVELFSQYVAFASYLSVLMCRWYLRGGKVTRILLITCSEEFWGQRYELKYFLSNLWGWVEY